MSSQQDSLHRWNKKKSFRRLVILIWQVFLNYLKFTIL